MRNKSIILKLFSIFILFTIVIFVIILLSMKTLLPTYYRNSSIASIRNELKITDSFAGDDIEKLFEETLSKRGGFIVYLDNDGRVLSKGRGRQNNSLNYKVDGSNFEGIFENKNGKEFFSYGLVLEEGYLVYEFPLGELNNSISTINRFIMYILLVSLIIASICSFLISRIITAPIISLNNKTNRMKEMKDVPLEIIESHDEVSQLHNSVVLMYEKLLSNIQSLETEVQKDKELERMKRQFLAQVTHELKTPIAIIQGYIELINEGIYDNRDEQDKYLLNIESESHKLNKLMNEVLDYSRIEGGFFTVEKRETLIGPWLQNVVDKFHKIVPDQIDLSFVNHLGDLVVNIDEERMEQVINNLVMNAIEHSDHQVIITASSLSDKLLIEVYNSGKAIDEKDIPFIFESFYKNEYKNKGTGLGLAIVKGIVELHGGDYRVENKENGVKFTIIV